MYFIYLFKTLIFEADIQLYGLSETDEPYFPSQILLLNDYTVDEKFKALTFEILSHLDLVLASLDSLCVISVRTSYADFRFKLGKIIFDFD